MISAFKTRLRRIVFSKVSADSSDAIFMVDDFGRSFDISYIALALGSMTEVEPRLD